MALLSLVVAIAALLISLASAVYTRRQAVSAEKVGAIERARLHIDLTPELTINQGGSYRPELVLELNGPPGLDQLDEVTVRIRDDIPGRKPNPASELTPEDFAAYVWGPYRIKPGLHSTGSDGREHGPIKLAKREPYPIPLEESLAPPWAAPGWRAQWVGEPVRVEVICRREGYDPWVLKEEVRIRREPEERVLT